jgi:ferric-dicitrate binding protein FerR (iron transport regulator)
MTSFISRATDRCAGGQTTDMLPAERLREPDVHGQPASDAHRRAGRMRRPVEVGAALLLAAGILGGLVLWAKWGFLIAFDAVTTYCFG